MSTKGVSIFNLPSDVISDILSRLPTKSLIRFCFVSTSSRSLIYDPSFTKLHLISPIAAAADAEDLIFLIYYESTDYTSHFYSVRSPINFQETRKIDVPYNHVHGYLRIVGSSKGLICFFDTNFYSNLGSVIFWNPSIQRLKKIKNPNYPDVIPANFSHFVLGFGFAPRNLDFKVVQIVYYSDDSSVSSALIYNLSTDSWKNKTDAIAPCYVCKGWYKNVFINGFVNWLGYKSEKKKPTFDAIMGFDLDDEIFRVMDLPNGLDPGYDQVGLADSICGQRLSLCVHYREYLMSERWDVWMMEEYGVANSWRRVCVVSHCTLSDRAPPLLVGGDGRVVAVMKDGEIMVFDGVVMKKLETCGLPYSFCAIRYAPTLALLQC